MDFREHIKKNLIKKQDRVLEFGPLNRPTVTKDTHPGIVYADVKSTDEIKKLYKSNEYLKSTGISVDLDSIVEIDHVVRGSYEDSFRGKEKFDIVILSHVIEHMPDIIFFFQDVMNVLKKNGKLILIYPDARYCFDHFRNGTTFVDAYDVYRENIHSASRVFDFVNNVVNENNPNYFWEDISVNNILPRNQFKDTLKAYSKALQNELPDDTHFWPFADYQFIKFLYDMDRAGLLSLDILKVYPTQQNTQEFMVILKPKEHKKINYAKYTKLLNKIDPRLKEIEHKKNTTELEARIDTLSQQINSLNDEIQKVYGSKRWVYASKLASILTSIKSASREKI